MTTPERAEDIPTRLVRIETKLDVVISAHDKTLVDHENRIRKLERAVWIATGAGLVAGGIAGSISKLIGA